MRLILGPAGSGKSTSVLNQVREALRARNTGVRLLVPTATLEQHLQNQLAREGFVFRAGMIQTLSRFVKPWVEDMPEASEAVLYLIVEETARRVNRSEFARVVQFPGFCSALARTIGELSSAGCDAARLASCLPDAPLAAAFLAVYQEVERGLETRGLWLRARRLASAAERIAARGTGGIGTIWLDGFHALPDPELRVIAALDRHADVTLTLSENDFTEPVRAMGWLPEPAARIRPISRTSLVRAPGIEREVEEIARRILEQAAAGRPFREIGIIVRPAESYVPILRATLERFGIPARFFFDSRLDQHAAVRCLSGIVDALLGGWDHTDTLAALHQAPRLADSNSMDRFDFAVREQIPNAGLDSLKALAAGADQLLLHIDALAALENWRGLTLTPKDWARRLRTLRNLFRPATPSGPADHEFALLLRSQATALDEFDDALDEAASALDAAPAALPAFWQAVHALLRLKPLRLPDGRRDVVQVLSAHEARQWVLPVVFICGMVEKQFPQFHRQDPFFPDSARSGLNAAGIRVRTAAEFEREERVLFESAISRATILATLSYPEFDARGERNLPSLFLETLEMERGEARTVRPVPRNVPAPRRRVEIRQAGLLEYLRQRTARLSPTGLESYLQCAFQYFTLKTMRLKAAPPRPEERFDFLTQGNIVHHVLAAWWSDRSSVEALFEETFGRVCEEKNIPIAYHTERLRNALLRDLTAFTSDPRWPAAGGDSRTEEKFEFGLGESLIINGKIDRLDITPAGAHVTDYKYSASVKARLKDPNLLQAPLYLLAAERAFGVKPVRMDYVGLKAGINIVGWEAPFAEGFFENAIEKTLRAVDQIRAGRIEPDPADPDRCRYCDSRDVCRIDTRKAAAAAEGA